ncbi:Signal transducer and activator of transcription 2 protein [Rutstroemia sp. NJR-2017a BVV2]|nr:Signal transducer and activator of transcription 2 protein [Rutstroemia sp. NJR-2017a BVV2]
MAVKMEQESFVRSTGTPEQEGGYAGSAYSADGRWDGRQFYPEDDVSRASESRSESPLVRGGYHCMYKSADHAREAKAARVNDQVHCANLAGALGIPEDPHFQKPYIESLYNAFMSVATSGPFEIIDKRSKNDRLAQAAQRIRDKKYPSFAVEEVCWEIFEKAQLAQAGVKLVDLHHGAKFQSHTPYATFNDRWDAIVDSCRRSKALCKMNLDPSFIDRFVCNPEAEYKMKVNNKKINAQRDEQNEIGRTFLSSGLGKQDAQQLVQSTRREDADEDDSATRPPSRRAGLSDAAPPATPLTPATPATKARPTRGTSAKRRKDWNSDTEDSDDDSEYVGSAYRSSAKPVRRSSRQAASSKPQAMSNDKPQLSSPSVRTGAGAEHRRLAIVAPHNANAYNRDHDEYKRIIFKLLDVDESIFKLNDYDLETLRTYARAYNEAYMGTRYRFPGLLNYTVEGYMASDGTKAYEHIAVVHRALLPLAVARGDLNENSELNENGNRTFKARTSVERQALGMVANKFGIHTTYSVIQPPILRSQYQQNGKGAHADGLPQNGNMANEDYRSEYTGSQSSQSFDQYDHRPHQTAEQQHHSAAYQADFKPHHSPNMFSRQNFNQNSPYECTNSRHEPRLFERQPFATHTEQFIPGSSYQIGTGQSNQGYHGHNYSTYSNGSSHEGSQYPDPEQYVANQFYQNQSSI